MPKSILASFGQTQRKIVFKGTCLFIVRIPEFDAIWGTTQRQRHLHSPRLSLASIHTPANLKSLGGTEAFSVEASSASKNSSLGKQS